MTQSSPAQPLETLIPRKYQITAIGWLTELNVGRAITTTDNWGRVKYTTEPTSSYARHLLSDDAGIGKTCQAAWAAERLSTPSQSILVLCPAHLVKQWFRYLSTYYTGRVISLEGTRTTRAKLARTPARWYVKSIQSLRTADELKLMTDLVTTQHVQCTIIDESHYVKNSDSKQAHHVTTLTRPDLVPHVILLSATPVVREADDLWSQLRIIDPVTFRSKDTFMREYTHYGYSSWGYQNVSLRADAMKRLAPYVLRRSYSDVGLELPPLIENPPSLSNLDPERRKIYDDIRTTWWTAVKQGDETATLSVANAMELLHMLRHVTDSTTKQDDLLSYLPDDPGPYLIATTYKHSAHALAERVAALKPPSNGNSSPHPYRPLVITGEIDARSRVAHARQSTSPNDVVIATIPALAEGCDLSHCNTVYFYEEDFTPGKMHQFLSRVRRHRNDLQDPTTTTTDLEPEPQPEWHPQSNGHYLDQYGVYQILVDYTEPELPPTPPNPDSANERPVILRYFNASRTIDERVHQVHSQRAVNVRDLIKAEIGL